MPAEDSKIQARTRFLPPFGLTPPDAVAMIFLRGGAVW
jgi:hypothetical protein